MNEYVLSEKRRGPSLFLSKSSNSGSAATLSITSARYAHESGGGAGPPQGECSGPAPQLWVRGQRLAIHLPAPHERADIFISLE
jgi:hypothetical protein